MLLDTCALLWLVQGGGLLTAGTRDLINKELVVYVSAISGFEIGMKQQKGKLTLPVDPVDWFNTVVEHHDLRILPLDLQTCIHSTRLQPIHADPCDRFIIATAQIHQLRIVTADKIFDQYDVSVLR